MHPFLLNLTLILATVYGIAFPSFAAAEPINTIWAEDRQKHAAACGAISGLTYIVLRANDLGKWESLVTSVAFAALVGTAKESSDHQVDPGDIKADFVGAIGASGVFFTFDLMFF